MNFVYCLVYIFIVLISEDIYYNLLFKRLLHCFYTELLTVFHALFHFSLLFYLLIKLLFIRVSSILFENNQRSMMHSELSQNIQIKR